MAEGLGINDSTKNSRTINPLNPYGILSPLETKILGQAARSASTSNKIFKDNETNPIAQPLAAVFVNAGRMFKQINDINKAKTDNQNIQGSLAVFSRFVMAAVFSDANFIYNQLAQMNKHSGTNKAIRKSMADSLYVWAVQVVALPIKAVVLTSAFAASAITLPLLAIPTATQVLRGKLNEKDSPRLTKLLNMATGYIIKPFMYDILNPYILIKDYLPVVSWTVGARKLFSSYTQINNTLASNNPSKSNNTTATVTSVNTKNRMNDLKTSFHKALALASELQNRQPTLNSFPDDIALNQAINAYNKGQPNALPELKREIALRYLEPRDSHTKNKDLLNIITTQIGDPLLTILAENSNNPIIMQILFKDHQFKNVLIEYLADPKNNFKNLQNQIQESYKNKILTVNRDVLSAHKNTLHGIYEQLAKIAAVELDQSKSLSPGVIQYSHSTPTQINQYTSEPSIENLKLIQDLKQKLAANPEITKFEKCIAGNDVHVLYINGTPNFILQTKYHYLGGGTSGEVYTGTNLASPEQKFALKILRPNENIDDLEREVRTFNLYYDDQPNKKSYLINNKDNYLIVMPIFNGKPAVIYPKDKKPKPQQNLKSNPFKNDSGTIVIEPKDQDNEQLANKEFLHKGSHEYKPSHRNRHTKDDFIKHYQEKFANLNAAEKSNSIKLILKFAFTTYKPRPDEENIVTKAESAREKSKVLDANLDPTLILSIIEDFKAICKAVLKGHEKGIIFRDLKPDNFNISTDPNTGEVIANLFDFGTCALLNNGESCIVDMGTLAYGSPDYLTQKNNNINDDIEQNLQSYISSITIQALTDIIKQSDAEVNALIGEDLKKDNMVEKIDFILKNPTLLDNFVYSKKTDAYALGYTLEEMIALRLNLTTTPKNMPEKYVYSENNKSAANDKNLDMLNGLLKIARDLKDQALSRKTPEEALERLKSLNIHQPKLKL